VLLINNKRSSVYERTRPDGRVIEIRRNPVPDGGFVLIFSDITERKRSEEEIRAARDAAEEASRTIEAAYRDLKAAQASLIQAEKMASLGRELAVLGHAVLLIPPQYVKPYVKRGKNDRNDAEAICEAAGRSGMHFVPAKSLSQQAQGMVLKVRDTLIGQRTLLVNPALSRQRIWCGRRKRGG